jgi:hypothetical protein
LVSAKYPEPLDLSREMAYDRVGLTELSDAIAKGLQRFVGETLAAHPASLPAPELTPGYAAFHAVA